MDRLRDFSLMIKHVQLVESIVSVQLSHIEVSPFWPDDGVHLTLVDTYASQISYSSHALS